MNSNSPDAPFHPTDVVETIEVQLSETLKERQRILGAVTWLMMNSELHRKYTIQDLSERIIPSVIQGQFRLYEQNERPIGFVNWAFLSDEVEQKYSTASYALEFSEWASGAQLWIPEFIVPFGHTKYIFQDLRRNLFPTQTAKGFKINPDGTLRGLVHYKAGKQSSNAVINNTNSRDLI
jgi:cytolysin-activating lysine-acyltransferase